MCIQQNHSHIIKYSPSTSLDVEKIPSSMVRQYDRHKAHNNVKDRSRYPSIILMFYCVVCVANLEIVWSSWP